MAAAGAAPAVAVAKVAGAAPAVAAIAPGAAPVADPRAAALALINALPDTASERVLALQREKKTPRRREEARCQGGEAGEAEAPALDRQSEGPHER